MIKENFFKNSETKGRTPIQISLHFLTSFANRQKKRGGGDFLNFGGTKEK